MDFDDLLSQHRRAASASSPRCWSTTSGASARARRRVPGHQPGAERAGAACSAREHRNVCVVGDQRPVDLRVPGRRHPQHPRVRGGVPRRHGDRARAELPVDADHPRRGQRGHRQQPRPQAQGAVDRPGRRRAIIRYHADDETDEAQWVAHQMAPAARRAATTAGATSPSSTGPTPRAGSSRSSSCGPASRTRSSAAPASTTGARSRTRWPT